LVRLLGAFVCGQSAYARRRDARAGRAAALNQSTLDPSIAGTVLQELMRGSRKNQNGLTEREMEVLRQLAQGKTNKEIADMLVVSEETIKIHVGNILTKLQLAHRMQAVLYALKQGLISLDEVEL
jgi:two-component system, NarL family, response regulator LiaR